MIGEFSYTVSHDLRAPRRGMQAYSKALLEDCSDLLAAKPHAIEYLQRIADNATRLDNNGAGRPHIQPRRAVNCISPGSRSTNWCAISSNTIRPCGPQCGNSNRTAG